jgi:hypothetical protein
MAWRIWSCSWSTRPIRPAPFIGKNYAPSPLAQHMSSTDREKHRFAFGPVRPVLFAAKLWIKCRPDQNSAYVDDQEDLCQRVIMKQGSRHKIPLAIAYPSRATQPASIRSSSRP